jgi:molybdopterin-containing oxidoreductase family iron-sulfur binding subunit
MRPLYDTRSTVDVLLALAQELGGAVSTALPWPNEVEYLREAIAPLNTSGASDDAFWSQWRRQGGYWSDQDERVAPQAGAAPQPVSVDGMLPKAPTREFPYELVLYPTASLFDGRGANRAWLQETPDPMTTVAWQTWIEISPETAATLGVKDDDVVKVVSLTGTIEAIVYVYPAIPKDVLAMPIGRGHAHYGRFAAGYGSNALDLLRGEPVEGNGAMGWGSTWVRIVRTERQQTLARLESPAGVEYMLREE